MVDELGHAEYFAHLLLWPPVQRAKPLAQYEMKLHVAWASHAALQSSTEAEVSPPTYPALHAP